MTTKNHDEHNGYGISKQTLCPLWLKRDLKDADHNEQQEPLRTQ
jgi:hypothetical protein